VGVTLEARSLATLGVSGRDSTALRRRIAEVESRLADATAEVGSTTERIKQAKKQKLLLAALVELTAADSATRLADGDGAGAVSVAEQ
jgi:hypothetical protein